MNLSEAQIERMPAVLWLMSVAPVLARIHREERAVAELHAAHVEAFYTAEPCSYCGDSFRPDQLTRIGRFHLRCVACEGKREPDEWWRVEEGMRKRAAL